MTMEEEVFLRFVPDEKRLEAFGFQKTADGYVYREQLMNGDMEAIITVCDERVTGRVIDVFSEDDYTIFRMNQPLGHYAAEVKKAYVGLLERIAGLCFIETAFVNAQTRRIVAIVTATSSSDLEFRDEDEAFFYDRSTKMSYADIIYLDYSETRTERVEVLRLPITAYSGTETYEDDFKHQDSYVTLPLDDTLSDEALLSYLDTSRALMISGSKEHREWIYPANAHYFNVEDYFDETGVVDWHQSTRVKKGDYVYIYLSAPYSCLLYQCLVTETHMKNYYDPSSHHPYLMRLTVMQKFDEKVWTFARLKQYGVKAIRGPRSMPKALSEAIFEENGGK